MLLVCPVFATVTTFEGDGFANAMKLVFTTLWSDFLNPDFAGVVSVNFTVVIAAGVLLLYNVLPFLFKNKAFDRITYVPKGNLAHTFPGHQFPTPPGKLPVDGRQTQHAPQTQFIVPNVVPPRF
jgi:hypothetical protein